METTNSTHKTIGKIEFLPEEQVELLKIVFDQDRISADRETYLKNAEVVSYLFEKLLERGAIPDVRLKYLRDPAYQSGGTRYSIIDRFIVNGNETRKKIVEHPHFLRHFSYLIFGANLPDTVKEQFKQAVDRCHGVNSSDAFELGEKGRAFAENIELSYSDAPEEFYKLALDCGVNVTCAQTIRDRMKALKPRKSRRF